MEDPAKNPDVARIFAQLLDAVGMNAAQFARKIGSTPQAISTYMIGRSEPSRKMLAQIIETFPAVDATWLTTGKGEPFPTGRHGSVSAPAIAEEPAAPYAPTATDPLVRELIQQLADEKKHHREELRELKRDHREDLSIANRTQETLLIDMRRQIEEAKAETLRVREEKDNRIYQLEAEVHMLKLRAGLRVPTEEEAKQMEQQGPPPAKRVKGLRSYEEETPQAEELVMAVSYSNPSFTRPQAFEQEVSHLQAA